MVCFFCICQVFYRAYRFIFSSILQWHGCRFWNSGHNESFYNNRFSSDLLQIHFNAIVRQSWLHWTTEELTSLLSPFLVIFLISFYLPFLSFSYLIIIQKQKLLKMFCILTMKQKSLTKFFKKNYTFLKIKNLAHFIKYQKKLCLLKVEILAHVIKNLNTYFCIHQNKHFELFSLKQESLKYSYIKETKI